MPRLLQAVDPQVCKVINFLSFKKSFDKVNVIEDNLLIRSLQIDVN